MVDDFGQQPLKYTCAYLLHQKRHPCFVSDWAQLRDKNFYVHIDAKLLEELEMNLNEPIKLGFIQGSYGNVCVCSWIIYICTFGFHCGPIIEFHMYLLNACN